MAKAVEAQFHQLTAVDNLPEQQRAMVKLDTTSLAAVIKTALGQEIDLSTASTETRAKRKKANIERA